MLKAQTISIHHSTGVCACCSYVRAAQVLSVAQSMEWVMLDSLRDEVTWS